MLHRHTLPYFRPKKTNLLTNVLSNYIQPRTGLTFSTPIHKNGKVTNWWKICCLVYAHELYYHEGIKRDVIVTGLFNRPTEKWPGWYCNVFAALNQSGLLSYDHNTRKWETGRKFEAYRLALLDMQSRALEN